MHIYDGSSSPQSPGSMTSHAIPSSLIEGPPPHICRTGSVHRLFELLNLIMEIATACVGYDTEYILEHR